MTGPVVIQGIHATVQASAFQNETTMLEYQNKIWKGKHGPASWGDRVLGIFDSAGAHLTERVLDRFQSELRTDTVIIPGGCTSKAQPMDITINRSVKSRVHTSP